MDINWINHKQDYKQTILTLAREHKSNCKMLLASDEPCGVSLILLYHFALKAGIEFTKEETDEFMDVL